MFPECSLNVHCSGGESIHGKKFKDDKDGLKLKIDKRGVLAMGNTGKNSNSSQFFISLADVNRLTGIGSELNL
jgi:cyclophilin family peptidyl-prolyl cis-trans isomerase